MRIQSIDTLKGVAILMVVVIHTEPLLAIPSVRAEWYYLGHCLQQICSFAVPFFFVTAGYFFSRGIDKGTVFGRWQKYTARLSIILVLWVVIDGIFWGQWLEQLIKSGSLSPLSWNLRAIPSFAAKRPELFFLRGTAVPLWFLISLIMAISILAIFFRYSLNSVSPLFIGSCFYVLSLAASSYSGSVLGIGLELPIEQRGPLIAFSFLTIGHNLASRQIQVKHSGRIFVAAMLLVLLETTALSHLMGVPFQERGYLFSTLIFAAAGLLFALKNPAFGTNSLFSRIGQRSLGIYLIHTPILGALGVIRGLFVSPMWEVLFPCLVLALSYFMVAILLKIPYVRFSVQ